MQVPGGGGVDPPIPATMEDEAEYEGEALSAHQ